MSPKLEAYIEAAAESSGRSRTIALVMVIASILTFITFYNAWPNSWRRSRYEVVQDATQWWPLSDRILSRELNIWTGKLKSYATTGAPNNELLSMTGELSAFTKKLDTMTNDFRSSTNELQALAKRLEGAMGKSERAGSRFERVDVAKDFAAFVRRFHQARVRCRTDPYQLEDLAHAKVDPTRMKMLKKRLDEQSLELMEARIDNGTSIHIAPLGVILDINDLGLFSGITFLVLLLLMHFSIGRELENLKYVLGACAKEGDCPSRTSSKAHKKRMNAERKMCYELLAMRQVLTVPPGSEERQTGTKRLWEQFWRYVVPFGFLSLPALLQTLIAKHEWSTIAVGATVSPESAWREGTASVICCVVIWILTAACFHQRVEVDGKWTKFHKDIQQDPCNSPQ